MGFSISISGDSANESDAEGSEQSFIDDLVAVIANHKSKLTYAAGSFQYAGSVDLLAAAGASSVDQPADQPADSGQPDTSTEANPSVDTSAGQPETGTETPTIG